MQHSRSQRLMPLLKLEHQREREAARQLGEAQKVINEFENKIAQLQQHKYEYHQRFNQSGSAGVDTGKLNAFRLFLENVDGVVARQQKELPEYEELVALRLEQWRQANVRYQALKKLVEKCVAEEKVLLQRAEQNSIDDIINSNISRSDPT